MLSTLAQYVCRSSAQTVRSLQFQQLRTKSWRNVRERYRKKSVELKETIKSAAKQPLPYQEDLIALRPSKHLWKALGFTIGVGALSFAAASIFDYERARKKWRKFLDGTGTAFAEYHRLHDGARCTYTLIGLNVLVMLAWRVRSAQLFMWRYFTNSFASKALCLPMVLSAFSHANLVHLVLNMYVLNTFAPISINRYFGVDQFWAFYITAAAVSSLAGMIHKCVTRSNRRALGASGAILGLLIYACMKMPDARLHIVFLPYFNFSAQSAVSGIIAFDLICLLLGFRMFDHAAHLGGSLFGMFYATYGERLLWKDYRNFVLKYYSGSSESSQNGTRKRRRSGSL